MTIRRNPPTVRKFWRLLVSKIPVLTKILLAVRRDRGDAMVRSVVTTIDDVIEQYGVMPKVVFPATSSAPIHPAAATLRLGNMRVLAQPVTVIGSDWDMLWPFSTQLQRTPYSCDAIWKVPALERHLSGRSLFAGVDGYSYYHWLLGTLPKLLLALRAGHRIDEFQHILVNSRHRVPGGRPTFQTESLQQLGIPMTKIVWLNRGVHFRCDDLTLTTDPCIDQQRQLAPWAFDILREAFLPMARTLEHAPPLPTKIFISRKKTRRRRLLNEAELSTVLEAQGFQTIVLEDMPLAEQIALFHGAREIVGLHGAGLANIIFGQPGCRVIEIMTESWWNPCFEYLSKQAGASYICIRAKSFGPGRTFAADAKVDVEAVCNALVMGKS